MAVAVRMPRLGMTMEEGTVLAWQVPVGGCVARGQALLRIESEKAEVEIEATASGVLRHVYVQPGSTVPCGTLLAALTESGEVPFDVEAFARAEGEAASGVAASSRVRTSAVAGPRPGSAADPPEPVPALGRPRRRGGRKPVAPAARARARQLGVDVEAVAGSGPGGRVTREDVETHAARAARRVRVAADVALEVLREGAGEPLLLLPGFGADLSAFSLPARGLARTHRLLGLNPRGVAGSDAPDEPAYAVAQAARDAAVVIQTEAEGGAAHVMGASLGAAVALELALQAPERVRSLALLTPFLEVGSRLRAVLRAWCRVARGGDPETLARVLLPWLFSEALLADEGARERAARGLVQMAARIPAPTLERSAAGLEAWSGVRRREELGRIAAPTLLLAAGGDLLVGDPEVWAAAIPGARLVRIAHAGHALASEAPEAVEAALRAHLDGAGGS